MQYYSIGEPIFKHLLYKKRSGAAGEPGRRRRRGKTGELEKSERDQNRDEKVKETSVPEAL